MKAWVLNDIGDIRYSDIELCKPNSGWVNINVKAVGICGSDIPRIYTTGAHRMPIVPGHEFSGIISETGPDVDPSYMGKRVGVFPLLFCGECDNCRKGLYEMCRNYDYTGSRRDGAFAEYVSVPLRNIIEIPDEAGYEEAAMLEPMAVAVNAIRKGTDEFSLDKDARITVCGLGTIGIFVTMFLVEAGYANIYGIGNKAGQKKRFTSLGLPEGHYFDNASGKESVRNIQNTDLFFECVGKNDTIESALNLTNAAGCVVLVGNPYSDMGLDKNTYWKILRNQLTIKGVWNSRFDRTDADDWHYVLKRLKDKRINPASFITHRFPLSELDKGLYVMKNKSEDYCKVMII